MATSGEPGEEVSVSSDVLDATFLPELGMLGVSLRHHGEELLALPGGLEGYRAGNVTGLPLLAPWANRLGARCYEVEGVVVDLERPGAAHRRPRPSDPRHDVRPARLGDRGGCTAFVGDPLRLRSPSGPVGLLPVSARAEDRRGRCRRDAHGDHDRRPHRRADGPDLVRVPPLPAPPCQQEGRLATPTSGARARRARRSGTADRNDPS